MLESLQNAGLWPAFFIVRQYLAGSVKLCVNKCGTASCFRTFLPANGGYNNKL